MINNLSEKPYQKLSQVQVQRLFTPDPQHNYSHHAFLTVFNGKLYAIWSGGFHNEDDCGQRVMFAYTADSVHWSEPRVLVSPAELGNEHAVLTAAGFYQENGTLCIYFGYFEYLPESLVEGHRPNGDIAHCNTRCYYLTTWDFVTFTPPQTLNLSMVFNHAPRKIKSGRLIACGGILFPYSDDPSGYGSFTHTGIYGEAFGEGQPVDDSASLHTVTAFYGWPGLICEGSFFQTDDSVLHMMLRSNTERLWCTESRDDGASWCPPFPTDFSDCGSKFHFSRLPDSRFYAVSDSVPGSNRCPLTVCLSEDGENFSRRYILRDQPQTPLFPGMFKGGLYAYPHSVVWDGWLYVIYSVNKEGVEVCRVPLAEL